jgi:hypothetical protein
MRAPHAKAAHVAIDQRIYKIIYLAGIELTMIGFAQFLIDWQAVFENGYWSLQTLGDMLDTWSLHVHHTPDGTGLFGNALACLPISPTAMALGMAACFGGAIRIDRRWG